MGWWQAALSFLPQCLPLSNRWKRQSFVGIHTILQQYEYSLELIVTASQLVGLVL